MLPDEVSVSCINRSQAPFTESAIDIGASTSKIESLSIPCARSDTTISTVGATIARDDSYLVGPDRASTEMITIKSIVCTVLIWHANHWCRGTIDRCSEKSWRRAKIAIIHLLRSWDLPGAHH